MSLDTDALLERRRLRRRLVWWRAGAIVLAVALVIAIAGRIVGGTGTYVARLTVAGVIVEDAKREALLARIARDDRVEALIVRVNSPGGTVVGGQSLYRNLRAVAKRKPVVAVMGTMATSAGYMISLGADHIVAHEGTITGSIGVVLQATNLSGLLDKLGIKTEAIKSAPLKAVPSPLEPLTPEGRAATQAIVLSTYRQFLNLVSDRRKITGDALARVGDGRVFTGRQALELRLVDSVGGPPAARRWLESKHGLQPGFSVRDVRVRRELSGWRAVSALLGGKTVLSERLTLDGLISVWHPRTR